MSMCDSTTVASTTLGEAVRGDVNDLRRVRLNGVEDLDNVTSIRGWVWNPWKPNQAATELTVIIEDSAECIVEVNLGESPSGWLLTANPGSYVVEIEATFSNGSSLTWPAGDPLTLVVRDDGG